MWWHHDWNAWNWLFMIVSMAAFWALIIGGVLLAIRSSGRPATPPPQQRSARETLDERFARGEISEEEYRRSRDALSER